MKKSLCKVFKIFYYSILCICPIHGKVETVLVTLYGIGKITAVRTVRYDKHLNILEKRITTVEALFGISVHLIECFADGDTASFQFNLYQWQTINQNCNVITIGLCPGLFKLRNNLQFISDNILFVCDIDVFNMSVVKNEIVNVVIVNLTGFIYQGISRFI